MPYKVGRPSGTAATFGGNASTLALEELQKQNLILKKTERLFANKSKVDVLKKFQKYPITFAEKVLGVELTPDQKRILRYLHTPPYRLMVAASHSVGKTFVCAVAVLHFFFTFPDSITLTTAPTTRQVVEAMWRNIRDLNNIDQSVYRGAYAPKMQLTDTHFAMGFVPNDADALNGLHSKSGRLLIVFDEAVGIPKPIWEAAHGIDNEEVRWVCIFNPTDVTSQCFSEWNSPYWRTMNISSLDHPNIKEELKGNPPPFEGAVRLKHLTDLLEKWSEPVPLDNIKVGDIEWPPGSNKWLRPSPVAQSRLLGLWVTNNSDSVWNHPSLEDACNVQRKIDPTAELVMGVDIARTGEDYASVHVRIGNVSLAHERRNGLDTIELSNLVERMAKHFATEYERHERDVTINVDITGIGAGVFDYLKMRGMNAYDWNFGQRAFETDKYPNLRSQIHFDLSERADNGNVDFTRLEYDIHEQIKKQALGIRYSYDRLGRRILEQKKQTRTRLGISPDDLDSVALAYMSESPSITVSVSTSE